jgi:hypothetical protein
MTRANARGKYKNEKASIALSFNEPIHIDARGKIKKWRDIESEREMTAPLLWLSFYCLCFHGRSMKNFQEPLQL